MAWRNLAQGNKSRHSEMVVESSDRSLFLKRNLALRAPIVHAGWPLRQTHAQPTIVERSEDIACGKVPAPDMAPGICPRP